jgi:hypothetical protein
MQKSPHDHCGQPCSGILHMPFCSDKRQTFTSTPTSGRWRFQYGGHSKSQVWLIRVESCLWGATIGGEPFPTVEGYLKRPPLVGAMDPQYFCVHRVILQVAEGAGVLPSRARAKERGRETYRSWSWRLQATSVTAIKDRRPPCRHRHILVFHLIDYVMIT